LRGWTQERAANLLELLQEEFCDVRLIAKGEEVPKVFVGDGVFLSFTVIGIL